MQTLTSENNGSGTFFRRLTDRVVSGVLLRLRARMMILFRLLGIFRIPRANTPLPMSAKFFWVTGLWVLLTPLIRPLIRVSLMYRCAIRRN